MPYVTGVRTGRASTTGPMLPSGTVASLLKPENKGKLTAILKYHVVAGRVYADDAVRAKSARTLQGSSVTIAENEGRVNVNGANVVKGNIDSSNGVIHVVDKVLVPSEDTSSSASPLASSAISIRQVAQ